MFKELVEYIVTKIVDYPDDVEVTASKADHITIIKLRVHPEDLGKVIGKEGRMARAIRTLVHSAAIKAGGRAVLEIDNGDSAVDESDDD